MSLHDSLAFGAFGARLGMARRFPTRLLFGAFLGRLAARRKTTRFLLGLAARRCTTRLASGALGVGFLAGATFALAGTLRPNSPSATTEGVLATSEGVLATREGVLATREGVLATREGVLATSESPLATSEGRERHLSAWRPSTFWPSTFQLCTSPGGHPRFGSLASVATAPCPPFVRGLMWLLVLGRRCCCWVRAGLWLGFCS